jgi:uncharacterized LabA/DUF88 family protein
MVTVFVDYQNAHLSAHNHWCPPGAQAHECLVDPLKLAERVISKRAPGGILKQVRVYRGRPDPRHQPDAARFSDRATAQWEKDTRVSVFRRPLRYPEGWGTDATAEPAREKGIDVQIAVDMVRMAIASEYEVGILFSRDGDLLPALELIFALGGPHTEVATWEGKSRLRLQGAKLFCHELDQQDFVDVRDPRNYDWQAPVYVPRPRGETAIPVTPEV